MAARFDPRPAHVLSLINEVLREQPRLSLVTAVCAVVQTRGDRAAVTAASAGHPLPLRRRPGEAPVPIGDHGVLLGVAGADDWTESEVELAPGETLLFFTDGVTETPGEHERFGDERLRDAVARAGDSPAELLAEIERALREFQAGVTLDDRAMLALRFVGVPAAVAAR
jgi:sigma-B regulation protein RsbU (phosphoserine phosphatase)